MDAKNMPAIHGKTSLFVELTSHPPRISSALLEIEEYRKRFDLLHPLTDDYWLFISYQKMGVI